MALPISRPPSLQVPTTIQLPSPSFTRCARLISIVLQLPSYMATKTSAPPTTLSGLPLDIHDSILSFVSPRGISRLMRTSKFWSEVCLEPLCGRLPDIGLSWTCHGLTSFCAFLRIGQPSSRAPLIRAFKLESCCDPEFPQVLYILQHCSHIRRLHLSISLSGLATDNFYSKMLSAIGDISHLEDFLCYIGQYITVEDMHSLVTYLRHLPLRRLAIKRSFSALCNYPVPNILSSITLLAGAYHTLTELYLAVMPEAPPTCVFPRVHSLTVSIPPHDRPLAYSLPVLSRAFPNVESLALLHEGDGWHRCHLSDDAKGFTQMREKSIVTWAEFGTAAGFGLVNNREQLVSLAANPRQSPPWPHLKKVWVAHSCLLDILAFPRSIPLVSLDPWRFWSGPDYVAAESRVHRALKAAAPDLLEQGFSRTGAFSLPVSLPEDDGGLKLQSVRRFILRIEHSTVITAEGISRIFVSHALDITVTFRLILVLLRLAFEQDLLEKALQTLPSLSRVLFLVSVYGTYLRKEDEINLFFSSLPGSVAYVGREDRDRKFTEPDSRWPTVKQMMNVWQDCAKNLMHTSPTLTWLGFCFRDPVEQMIICERRSLQVEGGDHLSTSPPQQTIGLHSIHVDGSTEISQALAAANMEGFVMPCTW